MANRKVTVEFIGDDKKLSSATKNAGKDVDEFSDKLGKIKDGAMKAGVGFGALAVGGAVIYDTGLKLQSMDAKAKTVFAESLPQVEAWSSKSAAAMGLTQRQATDLAAGMADLLKPMGFTAQQAAEMSTKTTDLAGALSAWSNGTKSAAEVSDILTSAMLGETDGLKALGIAIGAADIEARLAAKGQAELTGAARQQAEALAIQELIFEKSTDAQKAWNDGTYDAVKAQNEMKAKFGEVKEDLVTGLMPALTSVAGFIADDLIPAGERFVGWAKEQWPGVKEAFQDAWSAMRGAWDEYGAPTLAAIKEVIATTVAVITEGWRLFGDDILNVVSGAFTVVKTTIETIIGQIRAVIQIVTSLIQGDWSGVWDGIKGYVSATWEGIKGIIDGALQILRGSIGGAFDGIRALIGEAWDRIKSGIGSAWDGIKSAVAEKIEGIKSAVSTGVDEVVGFFTGLPGRITETIGDIGGAALSVGKEIIKKLGEGLSNVVGFTGDIAAAVAKAVKGAINALIDKVNSALEFKISVPFGPDININPPDIPRLHTGGVFRAGTGRTEGLALLEDGETVFQPDQLAALADAGFGGRGRVVELHLTIPVTVNAAPGADLADTGRQVFESLAAHVRLNGVPTWLREELEAA